MLSVPSARSLPSVLERTLFKAGQGLLSALPSVHSPHSNLWLLHRRKSKAQLETECSHGLLSTESAAILAEAWESCFDLHGWEAAPVCPEKAHKKK